RLDAARARARAGLPGGARARGDRAARGGGRRGTRRRELREVGHLDLLADDRAVVPAPRIAGEGPRRAAAQPGRGAVRLFPAARAAAARGAGLLARAPRGGRGVLRDRGELPLRVRPLRVLARAVVGAGPSLSVRAHAALAAPARSVARHAAAALAARD